MKSELIRKQEIISKTATQLRETISQLKDELEKLNVEGDLNPLSKLKEDILTETLIYESKKREIEAYEPLSQHEDQEQPWNYWTDEPEFELPKDVENEEDTGLFSVLSLPSFNFKSSESAEQAP